MKLTQSIARTIGFTLIELVLVISIVGVAMTLLFARVGTFDFWKEEAFIRKLSETIVFIHHQAVVDQSFYRIEFDFDNNEYTVGVMKAEGEDNEELSTLAVDVGNLSLELAAFLSPSIGVTQTMIPPPGMPSLAEPVKLPEGMSFTDIRTMRGIDLATDGGTSYLLFSPRGFSEFGVIHLQTSAGGDVSILVNSFTGLTEIFRSYRDFEWTYGNKNKKS